MAKQSLQPPSRRAFTLIELMVAIGIIAILLAILLPAMERVRHKGYISACASNLRQIGQAVTMYANDNHGSLPRTRYVPGATLVLGTGTASPDPFAAAGPTANDVTAPLWLLARVQRLPTNLFMCPYDDVNEFEADRAQPSAQSNFTDYKKNLGYSYANPYPTAEAAERGYKLTSKSGSGFAIAADLNPGVNKTLNFSVFRPTLKSTASQMAQGNSENHEREGQNVLYLDGHVVYESTPFCGVDQDNIYTAHGAIEPLILTSPTAAGDSVLLPAD